MNRRAIPGAILLFVAIVFGILGLRGGPKTHAYLAFGVAFAIIAAMVFRRAKAP